MIGEIYIVSEGGNVNQTWFSEPSILDASNTLPNKPIVCQFNSMVGDFDSHAKNDYDKEIRKVAGVIPSPSNAEMVDCLGKRFLKCRVVFWKYYYPEITELLANNTLDGTDTKISMEIMVEESHTREDNGFLEIDKFRFMGISLLGKNIQCGITGANVKITKFSLDEMIADTNKRLSTYEIPKSVKDNAIKALSLQQKNPQLINVAKDISNNETFTFSKIEWINNKINSLRKDDNLLFYGGQECKEWCEEILNIQSYSKKGEVLMEKELDTTNSPDDDKTTFSQSEANENKEFKCEEKAKECEKEKTEKKSSFEEDENAKDEDDKSSEEDDYASKYDSAKKELDELKATYEKLTSDYSILESEIDVLKTYKAEKEKEALEFKANKLLSKEEYAGLVSDEERDKLFETSLHTKGFEEFSKDLAILVLPKVFARQATIPQNKEEVAKVYSVPNMGDLTKEEKPYESSWDRGKDFVKKSGLI